MNRRTLTGIGTVGVLLLGTLVAPETNPVYAHPRSDYYSKWWQVDTTPEWHFDSDFPAGSKRARAKDGAGQWNAVAASMDFVFKSTDLNAVDFFDCPDDASKSSVHFEPIDGSDGTLGETRSCHYAQSSSLKTFHIRFDSGETWYDGTGSPGTAYDFWSAASHEFGHATGFGLGQATTHFPSNDVACTSAPPSTMCATYFGDMRDIETHDIHTFQNRYP